MRASSVRRRAGRPDLDFRDVRPSRIAQGFVHQPAQLGHQLRQFLASCGKQVGIQQLVGRAIGQFDPALRIKPDHAGGNARKHGLRESPAVIDLPVRVHQLGPLGGELAGHAVEGARQTGNFVLGLAFRHAHGKIAAAHPFGGLDQPADRAGDLIGHQQPDQHGRR